MSEQEFDKRDLNKDGKVSLGEKIGYSIDKAQEKLEEAAGKAKVKAEELKEKAPGKFAEMKEEVKEAADKAKVKAAELKGKASEKFAEMKEETKEARKELQGFVTALQERKSKEQKTRDEYIDRKLGQLERRQEKEREKRARREGRKGEAATEADAQPAAFRSGAFKVGEKVRIKDNGMVGRSPRFPARP